MKNQSIYSNGVKEVGRNGRGKSGISKDQYSYRCF